MQVQSDDLNRASLFGDLRRARRQMVTARSRLPPGLPDSVESARHDLVLALRACIEELDAARTPVPYRLRSELTLYEALDAPRSAAPYRA